MYYLARCCRRLAVFNYYSRYNYRHVYICMWVFNRISRFQHSFVIGGDSNRSITNLVVSGMGVWLSLQNSAVLRLVHSTTYEVLAEVNTAPAVTKMLSSECRRLHNRAVSVRLICTDFFFWSLRLRRHYKATQSSVSSGHVVVGGQGPLMDRHQRGCCLDHDHSSCSREYRQTGHTSCSYWFVNDNLLIIYE